MGTISKGLNPNAVKTALDDIFVQEFGKRNPNQVDALSPSVFKQDSADSSAVIWELMQGTGYWEERQEEQNVSTLTPKIGNQKTFSVSNYAGKLVISKNFFDDNKHSLYEKMVRDFAETARLTRDKNAFGIYRGAFTTSLTADGVAAISDSHVALNGETIDNKVSGALSESTLNTALVQLAQLKSQDGTLRSAVGSTLLVPLALYKTACEISESELRSGTGNNDMNVYLTKYGINVATSPFLGAAAGGSDAAWFLLSDNHSIMRFVRKPVETSLVGWEYRDDNNYVYKGEFREVVGAMNFEGIVGSNGS